MRAKVAFLLEAYTFLEIGFQIRGIGKASSFFFMG